VVFIGGIPCNPFLEIFESPQTGGWRVVILLKEDINPKATTKRREPLGCFQKIWLPPNHPF